MNEIRGLARTVRTALGDLEDIDRRFTEFLEGGRRDQEAALLFGAYIDCYYKRLKTVFLQIAHVFGNDTETQFRHESLLYAMAGSTPERERVISDSAFHALDQLRAFRRFVRHNYRLDNYDWDRIDVVAAMYRKSIRGVVPDLKRFDSYLESLEQEGSSLPASAIRPKTNP